MNRQEREPKLNSEPSSVSMRLVRQIDNLSRQLENRVYTPLERFMSAPISLAQTLRERHPKIATAVAVGAFVPPVLLGAGYAWVSQSLLSGASAGADVWIVECAITKFGPLLIHNQSTLSTI